MLKILSSFQRTTARAIPTVKVAGDAMFTYCPGLRRTLPESGSRLSTSGVALAIDGTSYANLIKYRFADGAVIITIPLSSGT
jgi:hypothetical protein